MHRVVGKHEPFVRPLDYPDVEQRANIAVHRLYIAAHTAGDFAGHIAP